MHLLIGSGFIAGALAASVWVLHRRLTAEITRVEEARREAFAAEIETHKLHEEIEAFLASQTLEQVLDQLDDPMCFGSGTAASKTRGEVLCMSCRRVVPVVTRPADGRPVLAEHPRPEIASERGGEDLF